MISHQGAFLKAFAICGRVRQAAKAAKVDRGTHYDWMKNDPDYPAKFAEASAQAMDSLEDEATERATEGVFIPNTWQGEWVYKTRPVTMCKLPDGREVPEADLPPEGAEVQSRRVVEVAYGSPIGTWVKSDRLLEFLLKGGKPEKYRDKAVAVTGKDGGAIQTALTVTFVKPE